MEKKMKKPVRGRFAPSPSGRMHLGNLFGALLTWLDIRSQGGEIILRIEDLDPIRCLPEYALQIWEDLNWLGFDWDEGWTPSPADACYAQRQRRDFYDAMFERLEEKGLLYPCYCSRASLHAASAPHTSDGTPIYDGRCRALTPAQRAELERSGRRPAWRVRVPEETVCCPDEQFGEYAENLARDCGDFILRRADGVYAYQLAATADDGAMGITRVVRGRDLLASSPRQMWLLDQLGYDRPAYRHFPMLLAPDGRRLSKRERDLDVGQLRQRYTAEELLGRLAFLAGQIPAPEPVTPGELAGIFSWEKVPKEDIFLAPGWL